MRLPLRIDRIEAGRAKYADAAPMSDERARVLRLIFGEVQPSRVANKRAA